MSLLGIEELKNRIIFDKDEWLKNYKREGYDKILISREIDFEKEGIVVGIDLHVGEYYNYPIEKKYKPLEEELKLDPGHTINITTEEYIGLPRDVMGLVIPKLGCVIQGLSHIATKVDPGFHGVLIETISNLDRTQISIKRGDKFCTIIFLEVKGGTKLYEGKYLGQTKLEKVTEELEGVNPSLNPPANIKDVWRIAAGTLSITAFTTLGGLYGISTGVDTQQPGLILLGLFMLGLTTYHLLRYQREQKDEN